jgi:pyruvate,orthophosphate dikinase
VDKARAGVFERDPFESLDRDGVGALVQLGIERGRSVKPKLKIGICGEHGGEPASVKFCHGVGMDYVSCSPYRVPIARLAAAQAVIEERAAKPARKPARAVKKAVAKKPAAKKAAGRKVAKKATARKKTTKKATRKATKKVAKKKVAKKKAVKKPTKTKKAAKAKKAKKKSRR